MSCLSWRWSKKCAHLEIKCRMHEYVEKRNIDNLYALLFSLPFEALAHVHAGRMRWTNFQLIRLKAHWLQGGNYTYMRQGDKLSISIMHTPRISFISFFSFSHKLGDMSLSSFPTYAALAVVAVKKSSLSSQQQWQERRKALFRVRVEFSCSRALSLCFWAVMRDEWSRQVNSARAHTGWKLREQMRVAAGRKWAKSDKAKLKSQTHSHDIMPWKKPGKSRQNSEYGRRFSSSNFSPTTRHTFSLFHDISPPTDIIRVDRRASTKLPSINAVCCAAMSQAAQDIECVCEGIFIEQIIVRYLFFYEKNSFMIDNFLFSGCWGQKGMYLARSVESSVSVILILCSREFSLPSSRRENLSIRKEKIWEKAESFIKYFHSLTLPTPAGCRLDIKYL